MEVVMMTIKDLKRACEIVEESFGDNVEIYICKNPYKQNDKDSIIGWFYNGKGLYLEPKY
jgi:hypothetical protein